MKLKKKSGLMGAVIALSCASLVSVGFASWVISQGDDELLSGTITVDTISDNRHVITVSNQEGNQINFTAPKAAQRATNDAAHAPWLKVADLSDEDAENLVFTFDLQITNVPSGTLFNASGISYTLTAGKLVNSEFTADASLGENAGYSKAANDNLVGALPAVGATAANAGTITGSQKSYTANATGDTSRGTIVYEMEVAFKWGSVFNVNDAPVNPYLFYNDGTKSASANGDDAQTKLSNLKNYLTGAQYQLLIVVDETL